MQRGSARARARSSRRSRGEVSSSRGYMRNSEKPNASESTPMARARKDPARGAHVVAVLGLVATAVVVALVARHGTRTTSSGTAEGSVSVPGVTAMSAQTLRVAPRPSLGENVSGERGEVSERASPVVDDSSSPSVWTYAVKNQYPHDPNAFTQGLVYQSPDTLLESTGSVGGASTVRRVDLRSGSVIDKRELDRAYFAEGLTVLPSSEGLTRLLSQSTVDGKRRSIAAQIVWKKNRGFLYDAETLETVGEFRTPLSDGWGLTFDPNDPNAVIISDASDALSFVEVGEIGGDWRLKKKVKVRDGDRAIRFANELETVGKEIWANVIETECIARIDPESGTVIGWIDLTGIKALCDVSIGPGNVMNGIARDAENDRVFVTGKKWSSLFEIAVEPGTASLEEVRERCWPATTLPQYGYP